MGTDVNMIDLIAFASDPAFVVNGDMQVIGWNAGAEALMGYSSGEAIGQKCGRVLQAFYPTGEPLCSVLCEGRACLALGNKWSLGACRIRHRNGQMVSVGISTLVMPLEQRKQDLDESVAVIFLREINAASAEVANIQPLRIFTLGHFGLAIAGEGLDVDNWSRKKAVVLLKCLVSQLGRPVHRERLIDWLWPDADGEDGWKRLKVLISFLRTKLRAEDVPDGAIETVGQSYMLRRDSVWTDAEAFGSLVSKGLQLLKEERRSEAIDRFEEAESLYCGDYLEDSPYADWCAEERERLREIYLELQAGMVKCYADEEMFMEAVQICRSALALDPCRESFLRALLENLDSLGQSDWAEVQFAAWRCRLEADYGLEPTEETWRTYQRLVGRRGRKAG